MTKPRIVRTFIREPDHFDARLVFTGARYELQESRGAEECQPFVAVADPGVAFDLLAQCIDTHTGAAE